MQTFTMFITKQRLTAAVVKKLILLLLAGMCAWQLQAQPQQPVIRFTVPASTLGEALKEIATQTNYRISVNHTNFDVGRKVSLPSKPISLEDALKHLLYGTGRTYMIRGEHILIIPQRGIPAIVLPAKLPDPVLSPVPKVDKGSTLPEPLVLLRAGDDVKVGEPVRSRANSSTYREMARWVNMSSNPVKRLPEMAIKINLLYGIGTLTPNLGFEFGITPRSTIDIRGSYNQWGLEGSWEQNRKLAHWTVSAEYRYWFCERFSGHFVGAHGFFGYYNISEHNLPLLFGKGSDQFRYHGNIFGAGISYGYQWILGKHWSIEAQIGVGYGRMNYDRFDCPRCGDEVESNVKRNYFGPTRAGISLIYMIK